MDRPVGSSTPHAPPSYAAASSAGTNRQQHVQFAGPVRQSNHPPHGNHSAAPPASGFADIHAAQGQLPSRPDGNADEGPPPYHDWMAVPDTALYPPPPAISYAESPVANASEADATRAHAWCDANPLWPPQPLAEPQIEGLTIGFASPIAPPGLKGTLTADGRQPGRWTVQTTKSNDACFLSSVPLYSALHSPAKSKTHQITVYYEIKVLQIRPDSGIALGFAAPPQLPWRLPGWHRGSLGVHGDDGRRYVNDSYGGRDFIEPFKEGETIGLGMTLTPRSDAESKKTQARGPSQPADVEVFLTRDGRPCGSWDLHEEVDREFSGDVVGLEGQHDLLAAVGVYGSCRFEIHFGRHNWVFRPQ